MTAVNVFVAASLAVFATAAFALDAVNVTEISSVASVEGRGDMKPVPSAEPVVARPPAEVAPGGGVEPGPVTLTIQVHAIDVNAMAGRA